MELKTIYWNNSRTSKSWILVIHSSIWLSLGSCVFIKDLCLLEFFTTSPPHICLLLYSAHCFKKKDSDKMGSSFSPRLYLSKKQSVYAFLIQIQISELRPMKFLSLKCCLGISMTSNFWFWNSTIQLLKISRENFCSTILLIFPHNLEDSSFTWWKNDGTEAKVWREVRKVLITHSCFPEITSSSGSLKFFPICFGRLIQLKINVRINHMFTRNLKTHKKMDQWQFLGFQFSYSEKILIKILQ